MTAIILAAGYATRLYPYTLNTAKPLLKIGGKCLIDYILDEVMALPNIEKVVVISNDKFYDDFCTWERAKNIPNIKIINDGTISVDTRLGAIGDIQFAIKTENIDSDMLVVAGDNLFTFNMLEYYNYFKKMGSDCICVKKIDDREALKSLGVCTLDEHNKVNGFYEKPQNFVSDIAVYASYMIKRGSIAFIHDYLKEGNKKDAPGYFIEYLHKKTDVYAYMFEGECYDIGTVAAYEYARDNYKNLLGQRD